MKKSISFMLLKKSIRNNWYYLILLMAFSILSALLSSINPIIYQRIIDDAIPDKEIKQVIVYVVLLTCIPIVNTVLSNLKNKVGYKFSDKCSKVMRRKCFEKALSINLTTFDKIGSQKLMSVITRSVGRITEVYIYGDLVSFVSNFVQLCVLFVILYSYDVKIALLTFVSVPILLLCIRLFSEKTGKDEKNYMDHLRNGEKFLLQCFYGIKTVRSYNGQKAEIDSFETWLNKNTKLGWKAKSTHNLIRTILPNAISQIILGVLFIVCAVLIMKDSMSIGTLVAIISYIPLMISAINGLLSIQVGKSAISKIAMELDEILSACSEDSIEDKTEIQTIDPLVQFDNVNFSYDRENFSLFVRDLTINKGDFIVIVGESGGGKTSIMDILNKFYDIKSGEIYFCGEKLSEINPQKIREKISSVFQDVYIFNKSVKDNISYPNNAESEKLNEILEKSQLTEFVSSLPEKEETVISDFGENFSGGECQRISLARALYKDADILLFDEPTAALDAVTAMKIFDTIKSENINRHKTVILITHDVGKIVYASKVVVVNGGNIVECGTPEQLLNIDGYLKKIYDAQQSVKN